MRRAMTPAPGTCHQKVSNWNEIEEDNRGFNEECFKPDQKSAIVDSGGFVVGSSSAVYFNPQQLWGLIFDFAPNSELKKTRGE